MVAGTTTDVLPWRVRPPRRRPPDFVVPRARFGHVEAPPTQRIPFNRIQLRAAAGLVASKRSAAHALAVATADYSAIAEARAAHGRRFRADEGFSLTYLPFVAAAVSVALREHSALNAIVDGEHVVAQTAIHLGFAVDLNHEGLVVPVVRDADGRSVRGLARAIHDVADRARSKQLRPDDVGGATFTITNPGGYGTYRSFPIINRPQVAILSTDGVAKAVVAGEGGSLRIAPIGHLCLGYDAAAVGAGEAAAFVGALVDRIERTDWSAVI